MKSIFRTVLTVLVVWLIASLPQVAAAQTHPVVTESVQVIEIVGKSVRTEMPKVATTEKFRVQKGFTLWDYLVTEKIIRRNDWPKYRKETFAIPGNPKTDKEWANLSIGTEITVPRHPFAIIADEAEQEHARNVAIEQAERIALEKNFAQQQTLLENATALNFKFSLSIMLAVLAVFVLGYWLMYTTWKLSAKIKECERLKKELFEERKDPDRFVFPTSETHGVSSDTPQKPPLVYSHDFCNICGCITKPPFVGVATCKCPPPC